MDFGAGFKNGVLLLALIVAVHIIMTKPDAIQNLMMHSVEVDAAARVERTSAPRTKDDEETELLKFVYSDEDRGALDKFFRAKVAFSDQRFEEGADIVQNAHLKAGAYGIQDASVLRIPHEDTHETRCASSYVSGLDTFAADFSCPV